MRTSLAILAVYATFVAASPAPQATADDSVMDFDDVFFAPPAKATGPIEGASNQTSVYDSATASASASADVTTVAEPTGSGPAARLAKKWAMWGGGGSGSPTTTTSSKASKPTSSSAPPPPSGGGYGSSSTTPPKGSSSAPPPPPGSSSAPSGSTSAPPPPGSSASPPPTTSVPTQSSGSATTSATQSCTTQPEAGTYCGFINPEDPCAPQPDGYGPHVDPDTVDAFKNYAPFHQMAKDAPTPDGYDQTFEDLDAAVSSNTYLGLKTLKSYDTDACAAYCDETDLCTGFNVYIERDPSLNPTDTDKNSCPNPASITNYKCTIWGSSVNKASATNEGGWRGAFQVVIVGSNGYEKTNNTMPPDQPGWGSPSKCPNGGAIHYPGSNMGHKFIPGPFDPSVCASYADSQNKFNKEHDSKSSQCKMFNAYMVKMDGVPKGTYCNLFSEHVGMGKATYFGSHQSGHSIGLESSCTYSHA